MVTGAGKKKRVNILAGLAKERIDELREALVAVRQERDATVQTVSTLEGILSTFKEEYNPNFNDEGVKRAVRSWEEFAAKRDTTEEQPAFPEQDLDAIASEESSINWGEWEGEDESDVDQREYLLSLHHITPTDVAQSTPSKNTSRSPCVNGSGRRCKKCGSS